MGEEEVFILQKQNNYNSKVEQYEKDSKNYIIIGNLFDDDSFTLCG